MGKDEEISGTSDATDQPEDLPAPHLKIPVFEFFGSKWLVGGYNALEETQRMIRAESATQHSDETQLWYHGLTLYYVALFGHWNLSEAPENRVQAKLVQMDLLGLGLSSSKVAVDMLLAGYYSPAYATVRHMLETVMQWFYLELFPGRAYLWRTPPTSDHLKLMAMKAMKNELVRFAKTFQPEEDREKLTSYFHRVYREWGRMSAGSHPSGTGLAQVILPGCDRTRQMGANYNRHASLVGFDTGLFALRELLSAFETTNRVDSGWQQRFYRWEQEVEELREAMKKDPIVARAESDLERLRRAQSIADEEVDSGT